MAFRNTGQLGQGLTTIIPGDTAWNDPAGRPSPQLGTKEWGSDGIEYILVKASGSINAATQISINATTFAAATGGSSGFFTQADAVSENDTFWAKKAAV